MTTNYKLVAQRGKRSQTITFEEDDDGGAMMHSIFVILEKAKNNLLWSRGRIELINVDTNTLVRDMPAK